MGTMTRNPLRANLHEKIRSHRVEQHWIQSRRRKLSSEFSIQPALALGTHETIGGLRDTVTHQNTGNFHFAKTVIIGGSVSVIDG